MAKEDTENPETENVIQRYSKNGFVTNILLKLINKLQLRQKLLCFEKWSVAGTEPTYAGTRPTPKSRAVVRIFIGYGAYHRMESPVIMTGWTQSRPQLHLAGQKVNLIDHSCIETLSSGICAASDLPLGACKWDQWSVWPCVPLCMALNERPSCAAEWWLSSCGGGVASWDFWPKTVENLFCFCF